MWMRKGDGAGSGSDNDAASDSLGDLFLSASKDGKGVARTLRTYHNMRKALHKKPEQIIQR